MTAFAFRITLTASVLLGFAIIAGPTPSFAHKDEARPKGAPPHEKALHPNKESPKPKKDVKSSNLTGELQNLIKLGGRNNGTGSGNCNPPTPAPPSFWIGNENCRNGDTHPAQLVSQRYHCHCWGRCGYVCDQRSPIRTTTSTTRRPSPSLPCPFGGIWFPPRRNLRCFCQSFFRQPFYICTSWSGGGDGSNTTGSPGGTSPGSGSDGSTKPGCCCGCCCSHRPPWCPPCPPTNSTTGCTCPPASGSESTAAASSGSGSESTTAGSSSDSTTGGGSSEGGSESTTSGSTAGDTGATSGDTGSTSGDTGSTSGDTGSTTEGETKPSTGETTEGTT